MKTLLFFTYNLEYPNSILRDSSEGSFCVSTNIDFGDMLLVLVKEISRDLKDYNESKALPITYDLNLFEASLM